MLKRVFFNTMVFILAGLSFSACNKVENRVSRAWLKESLMAEDPAEIIWDFQDDGTLIRFYNVGEIIDTAFYTIEKKALYTSIKIIEADIWPGFTAPNGFFRVDKISDDKLILTRYAMLNENTDGAYLRREFISLD